jgi:hypothetical protein
VSGKRTASLTIAAFLLLCAVGFSVASCVERNREDVRPPMPRPAVVANPPLTIAWTYRACYEALTDDAKVKFFETCGRNHASHGYDFVACSLPGNGGPYAGPHLWTVEPEHIAKNLRSDTVVFQ